MAYVPPCFFDDDTYGFDVGGFDKGVLFESEILSTIDSMTGIDGEIEIAESFSITDEYVGGLRLNESMGVVDSIIATSFLYLNEASNVTDSVRKRILMTIRKITIRLRGGSCESDIELED